MTPAARTPDPSTPATNPLTSGEVRLIVWSALTAMFLSVLDQTIVATSLPSIAADFGDFSLISWVITAYLLSSSSVTLAIGKLSDLHGRRLTLRISLAIFIASSILCALAPSLVILIAARLLQGIGGGSLATLAQTIVSDIVAPRERGRYTA